MSAGTVCCDNFQKLKTNQQTPPLRRLNSDFESLAGKLGVSNNGCGNRRRFSGNCFADVHGGQICSNVDNLSKGLTLGFRVSLGFSF